jgi:hypothetical protein
MQDLRMLTHVVHEVTSGLVNVDSDEELRPSASDTILMSTDGIHKELRWFPSLKRKNVYVTLHPTPLPQ